MQQLYKEGFIDGFIIALGICWVFVELMFYVKGV
jgi:hypothetical protein